MSSSRVFVVTGSNKGIGKSVVKLLLQDAEEKIVYLTSRNIENGKKAVEDLEGLGLKPQFHQLDVNNLGSIESLRNHLVDNYGGLDVLVNNAGTAYSPTSTVSFAEQAEVTNQCNFFGLIQVCDVLFPILKKNARVVNLSSVSSEFAYRKLSPELKSRFSDSNLDIDSLKDLIHEFIGAAKSENLTEKGWPMTSYGVSKVGVSFLTALQQKAFQETPERNIIINSCCPGDVQSDMNQGKRPNMITPDQGADTPTYLALLPTNATEPKGQFCKLRKPVLYPPTD